MRFLITADMHPVLQQGLEEAGHEVDLQEDISQAKVEEIIPHYEGLIISSNILVNEQLIDKAIQLKIVARGGSGMENVSIPYAKSKGIEVISSPEGNKDAVGEQAVGMLLSLLHNISRADKEMSNGIWKREENRGYELSEKTIGLFGYGNTGKSLAQKLSGFGCKVLAYDKYLENYSNKNVTESTVEEILDKADIVSFHLPLTDETYHLVNETFISSFKKQIYLINTSRGKVVNTEHLINMLKSEKIIGAAMDVFENESGQLNQEEEDEMNYLRNAKNVILTPHIAGWTFESKRRISEILLNRILTSIGK